MELIKKTKPVNPTTDRREETLRDHVQFSLRSSGLLKFQLYNDRHSTLRWASSARRAELRENVLEAIQQESYLLDAFVDEIRPSLSKTTRRLYALFVCLLLSIGLYYLASSTTGSGLKIGPLVLPTSEPFLDLYLLVCAILFAAACGVGYLRKFLRDVFDYMKVSRYQTLWAAGIRDLQLPSNHVLDTETALEEGGRLETSFVWFLKQFQAFVLVGLPLAYLFVKSAERLLPRLAQGEYLQALVLIASLAILLLGVVVLYFALKLKFPAETSLNTVRNR